MMKMKKMIFAGLIALMMSGAAINAQTWDISATAADHVTATLASGTLTISGTGNMQSFSFGTAPWHSSSNTITSLVIEDGVTSIGDCAFYYCLKITGLNIPNSVTSIGMGAFEECDGLTSITIPNSVTSIGAQAFRECSGLTSVIVPNSVVSIGNMAFYDCIALTAINVDAANLNYSSDDGVLFNNNKTGLICYPAGKGGAYAISNTVTVLYDNAFYGCSGLTSVTIPSSVTAIGYQAFLGCGSLTSITCLNSDPNNITLDSGVFYGVNTTNCYLNVPAGSVSLYQAADQWKDFIHINGIATAIEPVEAPDITVYSQAGNVIVNSKTLAIKSVSVYNLSGQLLKTVESGSNYVSITQSFNHSILIVKVVMTNGTVRTKKVVVNG